MSKPWYHREFQDCADNFQIMESGNPRPLCSVVNGRAVADEIVQSHNRQIEFGKDGETLGSQFGELHARITVLETRLRELGLL